MGGRFTKLLVEALVAPRKFKVQHLRSYKLTANISQTSIAAIFN
jgi:hypothetical protein